MNLNTLLRLSLVWTAVVCVPLAFAQAGGMANSHAGPSSVGEPNAAERSVSDWLMRMHEASRRRAYMGTFVVSAGSNMATSKIWHVCDGEQQMERVESLTGAPRATFRRNDQVITFLPDSKVAVAEKRETLGLFPGLLKSSDNAIAQFYSVRQTGSERVAGFESEVVQLLPKDKLRFGYRIWSEKKTGLVVKLQTMDLDGRVLEQVAFSELQLDAPVSMNKLSQMMANTEGYRVEKPEMVKTTADAEGWMLKTPVPGFKSMSCYRRPGASERTDATVQWIFSDGLASVSLFIEAFDRRRHGHEGVWVMGATHTLARHLHDKSGDWWLTVVGEVPAQTLQVFAQGLERKK